MCGDGGTASSAPDTLLPPVAPSPAPQSAPDSSPSSRHLPGPPRIGRLSSGSAARRARPGGARASGRSPGPRTRGHAGLLRAQGECERRGAHPQSTARAAGSTAGGGSDTQQLKHSLRHPWNRGLRS